MKNLHKALLVFLLIVGLSFILESQSFKPVLFRLKDIKDISKTAPTDGQALAYVSATGLWTPSSTVGGAPTDAHFFTGQAEAGLSAEIVVSANGKSLITAANYATMRGLLDLEAGTDFNAYITALSGITNGIRITGASSAYDEITHDGTNVTYNASTGAHIFQAAGGSGAALFELSDGSSNYLGFQAAEMSADYTFIFPAAIGAEGQILRTGASPYGTTWTTATFPATAGSAGNALISDGTNWSSANVLSAVPTGLTYTTATRAISLTTGYMIPGGGTAGQMLISQTASAPVWTTSIWPSTATAYRLVAATATNTISELAAAGATGEYLAGATGAIPAWAALSSVATLSGLTSVGTITTGTWNALKKQVILDSGNNVTVDLTDDVPAACYGQSYTNAGNDSDTHYDLPAAVVGMAATFWVTDAYTVTIDPNLNDRIIGTSANGDYLQGAAVAGNMLALICLKAGEWQIAGKVGTWTEE